MEWYSSGEEYLDGVTRYEQGKKKLEQGEREYTEGKAEYEDGLKQLEDAQKILDRVDECRWVVFDNRGNGGYLFAKAHDDNLSGISYSFSSIFLVIAALVIYATIGRMVQEQRKLVGATKAMGLYNREILAKYLLFGVSAVLVGVALGVHLSWFVLQKFILRAYGLFYTYGPVSPVYLPTQTAILVAGALTVAALAVWLACSELLRTPAIRLMQGEQPNVKKRKARRSSRHGLSSRLILRNMWTDKRRVLVTVGFSMLISSIALRRVRNLKLTDMN